MYAMRDVSGFAVGSASMSFVRSASLLELKASRSTNNMSFRSVFVVSLMCMAPICGLYGIYSLFIGALRGSAGFWGCRLVVMYLSVRVIFNDCKMVFKRRGRRAWPKA